MADARKQPRAQVALSPQYLSPADLDFVDARSVDVSTGGMFIRSDRPVASGTLIKIRCEPAETQGTIEGVAKVVWIRTQGAETGPAGMGIKFVKLKGDSERVLQAVVDGAVAAGGIVTSGEAEPRADSGGRDDTAQARGAQGRASTHASSGGDTASEEAASDGGGEPVASSRPSQRPTASELAARLHRSRSDPPAARAEASSETTPDRTAPLRSPDPEAPGAAARAAQPQPSRMAAPALLAIGGLLIAAAALATWLSLH